MSYHYYLADKTEKLLIDAGNHVAEETFNDNYSSYKNVRDILDNISNSDDGLDELEIKKLKLRDIASLMSYRNHIIELSCIDSRWLALEYKYGHEENDLEYIGEDQLDKYKIFTRI